MWRYVPHVDAEIAKGLGVVGVEDFGVFLTGPDEPRPVLDAGHLQARWTKSSVACDRLVSDAGVDVPTDRVPAVYGRLLWTGPSRPPRPRGNSRFVLLGGATLVLAGRRARREDPLFSASPLSQDELDLAVARANVSEVGVATDAQQISIPPQGS